MAILVEKPTLRRKDMDAVLQTMVDETIGVGQHQHLFISEFCKHIPLATAFALRSGVDALLYALLALQLPTGSSVAVSALSPAYYAHVLSRVDLKPLILDVDDNGLLDIEALQTCKAEAVLLHQPYGNFPIDSRWKELTIPIIEDVSQSFGSRYLDQEPGQIGKLVVCTFEASSIVSTGGGAVVGAVDPLTGAILEECITPLYPQIGLADMNAALGVIQLAHMGQNIERRQQMYQRFVASSRRSKHSHFGIKDVEFEHNGYGFVVVMDAKMDKGAAFALQYEVGTASAFEQVLISSFLESFDLWPKAIPMVQRGLKFPLYPFLQQQQIVQIEKVIAHLP
ncbi:MAG: DegT/DnrJ/EryC1/StrS family aminotransferase [Sphaerochaetaceae bacterium]